METITLSLSWINHSEVSGEMRSSWRRVDSVLFEGLRGGGTLRGGRSSSKEAHNGARRDHLLEAKQVALFGRSPARLRASSFVKLDVVSLMFDRRARVKSPEMTSGLRRV